MKKTIKLLLLAALAWPSLALAQGQPQALQLARDRKIPAVAEKKVSTQANDAQLGSTSTSPKSVDKQDPNANSSGKGNAQSAPSRPKKIPVLLDGEITVADGTETDAYAPIWGYYCDNYYSNSSNYQTRSQMIYPASMLQDMAGMNIEGLTFYTDANGIQFSTAEGDVTLTVTLGVCESSSFDGALCSFSSSYSTVSQTVTPKKGDKTISVTFDNSFTYTKNTNLMVQVQVTTKGTADVNNEDTKFVGIKPGTNQSLCYYYKSGSKNINLDFLPKVTFAVWDSRGNFTIDKELIDFGKITCGETVTQNVTVRNTTTNPATISWNFAGLNADKFSTTVDESTTTLAAGQSLVFPITYTPGNSTGAMSGSLKVTVNNTLMQVMLHGRAVKNYDATVTPTSLDFGEVFVDGNGTAKVTLTNTGLQAIYPIAQTDNPAFTVSAAGSGDIAKDGKRTYTVYFNPTAEQAYTGTLNIHDDANGINLRVALKGTGVTTAAPFVVESQQSSTTHEDHTVADGKDFSAYVPIYGNYLDYGCEAQMTYPAEVLHLNVGDKINSIKFYASKTLNENEASGYYEDNPIIVKVHETGDATTQETTVCTNGSIWSGSDEVTFTFNEPYVYQGGDLVIDMSCAAKQYAYYTSFSWYVKEGIGTSTYSYNSSYNASPKTGTEELLPSMTMDIVPAEAVHEHVRAEEVAWGNQNVNAGSPFYSKQVTIYNPNSTDVEANLTIADSDPFSFAQNTTSKSRTMTLQANANTPLTLYFNPTAAAAYTGHLNIATGSHSSSTRLTGVGLKAGEIATRDSSFFAGITYDWTDIDGNTHTSNLTEIATDPDQIIALVRTVYTDKRIPGNWKRGFTKNGANESGYPVTYPAVGTLKRSSSGYGNYRYYDYDNTYGWNIRTNKPITCKSATLSYDNSNIEGTAYYAFMDSMEYKPDHEGVTLLLAEMIDDFNHYNTFYDDSFENKSYDSDAYKNLRGYIQNTVKTMRVVTEAKRTGTGTDAGTLFKLDADKLNKFYLLAKGRLRWVSNSYEAEIASTYTGSDGETHHYWMHNQFCSSPCYIYSNDEIDGYFDEYSRQPFRYMFEQFSPVVTEAKSGLDDLYSQMVDMKSFYVLHDCANVGDMNHQFMMYGDDSEAADCQDVRDLMFFVPDYRMLKDDDRDNSNAEKFLYYNAEHKPKIGLYVIHQDEVKPVVKADDHYTLKLTWDSNMDEYLPSDEQEYQLWKLEVDEFGVERYVPVYKRNAQGQYWNATTNQWQSDSVGAQQVVLSFDPTSASFPDLKTYTEVYEERYPSSHMVTYAVRGQDKGHFLSLQMSNEQSYLIPGTDPAEMVMVSSATYYSRYNPENEKNCYSNKLQLKANPNMVNTSYLSNSPTMTLNRSYSMKNANNETEVVTEPVATIKVNYSASTFTVTLANSTIMRNDFPNGKTSGEAAGYHANMHNGTDATQWTEPFTVDGGYVNFDFVIWDNFIADVSKNEHPGQYIYQLTFPTNGTIAGTQPQTNQAHSNEFRVPVYKTDSRINEPITLADVLGDTQMNPEYSPGDVTFDAQVQLSSKQNILRYDAYRWNEGEETRYIVDKVFDDDSEQDLPPTGMAGNQGDFYTVTMNAIGSEDYYVGSNVGVSTASTTNWATFVDYYPTNANTDAGAYTYAPVVELFTRGYKVGSTTVKRDDYNTYGGPLKNTAVGKLEVKPYEPTSADRALMSDYYWTKNGDKYSYYNILLTFNALDVPEGYELYKVRAWRRVDRSVLDEQLESRQSRIDNIDEDGWLLYEDINYGDSLTLDGATKMSCSTLKPALLGERSTKIARPQNPDATGDAQPLFAHDSNDWAYGTDQEAAVRGETRATFGARRLDLEGEDNDFPTLHAEFKVRAYFTRNTNPLIAGTGTQNAPRRAESAQAMTGSDFDYYVAEGRTEVVEHGGSGVITGITGVKADANREVVGVTYVNTLGQQSSRPFEGVNIVVTHYSDGTTTTTKVVK